MSSLSRSVTFTAQLLLWSAVPMMAQGVGAIAGTVSDSSGALVPGANVALTNPQGTLGGNQTTISNERGGYQFLRLVPGTYVVKADLPGFQPAETRGVIVNADTTSRADLALQPASVQGDVTVTAATLMLDTTSVQKITNLSRTELQELPNRSDAWSTMKIMPGVTMSASGGATNVDVGGSGGFQQSYITARGSTDEKYTIDGMDVTAVTSVSALLYLDPTSYQESNFQVGSANAENSAGGMTVNVVTRTGTNELHGGIGSMGSTLGSHLATAQNFTAAQRADLLASVPAAVLKVNPNLSPTANIDKFTDFNAWIAGPIIKNKLWFAGTWHDQRYNFYQLGAYELNGTEMLNDNILRNTTVKLSYQINKWSQLTYFNNLQYKLNGHTGGAAFGDDLARQYKSKYPDVNQVKYTAVLGTHFVLDAAYSRWRTRDIIGKEPAVEPGSIPRVDLATQTQTIALQSYTDDGQDRDVVKVSGSFLATSHNVHFGADHNKGFSPGRKWGTSAIVAQFRNGVPDSVVTSIVAVSSSKAFNAPDIPDQTYKYSTDTALYVQDKYTVTRRLVLNLGLRYERNVSGMDASCLPKTPFFAGQCYPALDKAPKPHAFLPRLGAIYDLKGDGKTALKFAFARYNSQIQFSFLNQMLATGGIGTAVISNTRTWADVNGDGIPQVGELGPDPGYNVPALASNPFSGTMRWPHTWEYTAGVERQLPGQLVASVAYVRRLTRDNVGTQNSSIPTSAYTPVTVTEKVTGKVVQVWLRDPAYVKAPTTNVVFNTPMLNTEYTGVEATLNKRMSHHLMILGGATFQKLVAHSSGGDLNNPTNRLFDAGVTAGSIPWTYRFSGVYQAPHGVMVSSTFQFDKGAGEMTTVLVGSDTIKFNAGQATTQTVNVAKRSVFLPNVVQLDTSVEKRFKLTERQTLSARINIYNGLNDATVTNRVAQLGPTYHRISAIQLGRMLKFGFNYEF